MSDCNFCTLQRMRRGLAKGKRLTVLADATWGMGGVHVYIHPEEVDIRKLEGGEDGPRSKYRSAWFMELPERCCC